MQNAVRSYIFVAVVLLVALGTWSLVHFRLPTQRNPRDIEIVRKVNEAMQAGDVARVQALAVEDVRPKINADNVGKGRADLGPLGAITEIVETTPDTGDSITHTFQVTFRHGTAKESVRIEPDGLVRKFHYDDPLRTR